VSIREKIFWQGAVFFIIGLLEKLCCGLDKATSVPASLAL